VGHFGGLPGPWHGGPKHGIEPGVTDGAPITCQACHAGTVDPAATLPGGFFWLDTTGDYDLGGQLGYACAAAATGAGVDAPAGGRRGASRPLRHVRRGGATWSSTRARRSPALPWLPAASDRPSRPYWGRPRRHHAARPVRRAASTAGRSRSTSPAPAYEPATKTCSNVACHLFETEVRWGAPHDGWDTCARCHPF